MTDPALDFVQAYTKGTPNFCIVLGDDPTPAAAPPVYPESVRRYHSRMAEYVATQGLMPTRAYDDLVVLVRHNDPRHVIQPRYKTHVACARCARNKLGCDSIRPCGRCVQAGRAGSCANRVQDGGLKRARAAAAPDDDDDDGAGKRQRGDERERVYGSD